MHTLFAKISHLTPTLEGWCTVEKAQTLAALVVALRPKVIYEIGVYAGRSFFPMAMALKEVGSGKLVGVEPWDNSVAAVGYVGDNKTFWHTSVDFNRIKSGYDAKFKELELEGFALVFQGKSDDVTPVEMDLLHIDGQHTEQAIRDVERFAPFVRVGGIIVMDDVDWRNDGDAPVKRSVDVLKNMGFVELYPLGTGAVFQRIK